MNLSDLQNKEIIDISSGRRMGSIIDVIVSSNGTFSKLILEDKKVSRRLLSNSKEDTSIEWKQIVKIGDDIILISKNSEINI